MYQGALIRLRAPEPPDAEPFYAWFNDADATAGLGVLMGLGYAWRRRRAA